MTTTVDHIVEGFTNTGRFPYAYAMLKCGHSSKLVLRPQRGACCTCGTVQELTPQAEQPPYRVCCGTSVFNHIDSPNPHREADRVTKVGDVVECEQCERDNASEAWLRSLDRAVVHHSRLRYGSYNFYRRAADSPSGVLLVGSVPATPRFDAILNELRYSPLSPTEGL